MLHNNDKGFTLVELLVSMLIFAIGVAALTQTLVSTVRGNNLGNKETIATNLANAKLDELRGVDPSAFYTDGRLTGSAAGANHVVGRVVPTLLGGTQVVTTGGYILSYIVTDLPAASGALFYTNAKQVDVTVVWADPASHSVVISSVLVPNI